MSSSNHILWRNFSPKKALRKHRSIFDAKNWSCHRRYTLLKVIHGCSRPRREKKEKQINMSRGWKRMEPREWKRTKDCTILDTKNPCWVRNDQMLKVTAFKFKSNHHPEFRSYLSIGSRLNGPNVVFWQFFKFVGLTPNSPLFTERPNFPRIATLIFWQIHKFVFLTQNSQFFLVGSPNLPNIPTLFFVFLSQSGAEGMAAT